MRASRTVAVLLLAACGTDDPPPSPVEPVFPADYLATFAEVRDCRPSGDHDLNKIRVRADPAAMAVYLARDQPFPVGAVVLKEEFDFADTTCTGDVVLWTVMQRTADPANLGWAWQKVSADRTVETEDEPRCIGCHQQCGGPPDGHDGTCAVP